MTAGAGFDLLPPVSLIAAASQFALGAVHNRCVNRARLRMRPYCSLSENQTRRSSQSTL